MPVLVSILLWLTIGSSKGVNLQAGISQEKANLSDVIEEVSIKWKQDSLSCKGFRQQVSKKLLTSKIDSVTQKQLLAKLGKPNSIQPFFKGWPVNKNLVGYIYFVYKDNCPKIIFEGYAIEIVLDEFEKIVVDISDINFCG